MKYRLFIFPFPVLNVIGEKWILMICFYIYHIYYILVVVAVVGGVENVEK